MNCLMKRLLLLWLVVAPALAHADKNLTKGSSWDCKKDASVHIGNGEGTYTFVQERTKRGDKWLITSLRIYVVLKD